MILVGVQISLSSGTPSIRTRLLGPRLRLFKTQTRAQKTRGRARAYYVLECGTTVVEHPHNMRNSIVYWLQHALLTLERSDACTHVSVDCTHATT